MNAPCRCCREAEGSSLARRGPDGSAIFAERNHAHPIVAASGALVGLSFQTVLLKLPGWANPGKLSGSPINLSVPARPVRLLPREMCWRSGNDQFSLSLGDRRGR